MNRRETRAETNADRGIFTLPDLTPHRYLDLHKAGMVLGPGTHRPVEWSLQGLMRHLMHIIWYSDVDLNGNLFLTSSTGIDSE